QTQTVAGIAARARRAALELLRAGTTAVRAHVDAGPDLGLRAVEALAQVRDELIDVVDLQIVAGLSAPYSGRAGLETLALGADALALGADHVGGAPHLDPDPGEALDALVELAASHGAGLDLHLDETLDPDVFTLPLLLDRVERGFPGPVAVGHLVSLAVQPLAVTGAARTALDLPPVDVVAGSPAELVAVVGASLADVVAGASVGRVVLHE